jgi:hypothetical protein
MAWKIAALATSGTITGAAFVYSLAPGIFVVFLVSHHAAFLTKTTTSCGGCNSRSAARNAASAERWRLFSSHVSGSGFMG